MMRGGRVSVRRKVKVLSGVVIRQPPRIDQDRLIPNPGVEGLLKADDASRFEMCRARSLAK